MKLSANGSRRFALALISVPSTSAGACEHPTITAQVDKPGAPIPTTLFGLFFEDINFGADGGLYPERGEESILRVS
jgi:hypothetical protein